MYQDKDKDKDGVNGNKLDSQSIVRCKRVKI